MDRDFKGVWIPKEIWLDNQLSLQEKMLLVEIDSLSKTEQGCYASNEHFADFLQLSKERARKVIASLVNKGYVQSRLEYKQGSRELNKRWLKVTYPPMVGTYQPPMVETYHDNNTVRVIQNKSNIFSPPTLAEVQAYCKAQGYHFNADDFYDYYEASKWHKADGKAVKNWKQCCVTWESTWKKNHPNTQTKERRQKLT